MNEDKEKKVVKEDYDCEALYEDMVKPLLHVAMKICRDNNIPYLFHAPIKKEKNEFLISHSYFNPESRFQVDMARANKFLCASNFDHFLDFLKDKGIDLLKEVTDEVAKGREKNPDTKH